MHNIYTPRIKKFSMFLSGNCIQSSINKIVRMKRKMEQLRIGNERPVIAEQKASAAERQNFLYAKLKRDI
ncbi:MAG: hypothetical protein B6U68_04355 [Candidatus Aenigmarchaeota archaeon ex4484_14]|nr:MAG: hypothetical protein B6U68_04355 [Candidatus Aenigmarchaeota archaeon ex4484_14]